MSEAGRRASTCSTTSRELKGTRTARSWAGRSDGAADHRDDGRGKGSTFPCVAPDVPSSKRAARSGAWVSELLPNIAKVVDDIAIVKSVNTEAIKPRPGHDLYPDPARSSRGRPKPGGVALIAGSGSENQDLPAFIVMISQGSGNKTDQPIFSRLWGSGFLPTQHQGVRFRSGDDPVLYLSNPPGMDRETRRKMLDGVGKLQRDGRGVDVRRPRDQHPDQPACTRWPTGCRPRPRPHGPRQKESGDARPLRGRRQGRRRRLRPQLHS